jgi:radical SAM PhpK family P-methyltransferase
MGESSGAYRDLNLNYIQYNGKYYTAAEIFNLFFLHNKRLNNSQGPLDFGNVFSATIAYLCTFLYNRGFNFDYVNSFQTEKEKIKLVLENDDVGLVAITTTYYVSVFPIMEIVSFVRSCNPNIKIIIGGPYIATQTRCIDETSLDFLFKMIDADFYVNSSQGEHALLRVVEAVRKKLPYDGIDNIHYKTGLGYVNTNLSIENNILTNNTVNWNLFRESVVGKSISVRTSISCPFSCSFCGFPQHAGKYQIADLEAVEREFQLISSLEGVHGVNFIDDTFNVPPERFKEILRMKIKNNFNFQWNSHFRCQFVDRETIELMKEGGCMGVFLGIESGNQKILKNMNKSSKISEYVRGIELLNKYDIITYASFIIGFPGETEDTIRETEDFINNNQPTFFRTQLWYCDPFTPIWGKRIEFGIKGSQFEWSHNTMNYSQACDSINTIFKRNYASVWVPQYNFEFINIFNLLHRGMDREMIKGFLRAFNSGIQERLEKNGRLEVSTDVLLKLADVLPDEVQNIGKCGEIDDWDFDFRPNLQ